MATSPAETAPRLASLPVERLWNLPNSITLLRTLAVPVLLFFPALADSRRGSEALAWIFIVAALTDLLDGWLARRGQQVTKIGKLLDPLCDKLLVATALIVLLAAHRIPDWGTPMVVVIIGREIAVTGAARLRAQGEIWQRLAGKVKTLQNIAIGALLFPNSSVGAVYGTPCFLIATRYAWSGYGYFCEFLRGGRPTAPEET
jgi:CDP-diacylglycerol--glycerol-3-phosphate 3-phosphatidyltransferase